MTSVVDVLLPIVAEVRIEAPLERLWEVATGEETVPQWLGCINYRKAVGTTFHMQQDAAARSAGNIAGATHCDVVRLSAPHKFDFTWYVPGTPQTLVELSFFSEGTNHSFVRLVHGGWDQFNAADVGGFHRQLSAGWKESVLPGLKRLAERG